MFNKLYQSFLPFAKPGYVLILILVNLLFAGFIFPWSNAKLSGLSNEPTKLIDSQFNYSTEQVYQMLKAYGGQGREWYTLTELTIDAIYPMVYALLLSLLMIFIFTRITLKINIAKFLFWLPVVTIIVDYSENACILLLLINYPYKLDMIVRAANVCTSAKWILLFISCLCIAAGSAILIIRYIRFKFFVKSLPQ